MLVVTGMYSSAAKIPEFVPYVSVLMHFFRQSTMNRYSDRLRILGILMLFVSSAGIFMSLDAWSNYRIDRDRRAGKVVTHI